MARRYKIYNAKKPPITSYKQLERLFDSGYREFNGLTFGLVDLSKPDSDLRLELSADGEKNAVFYNCHFTNCNLRNVSLHKFTLRDCHFDNCDLTLARFLYCELNSCTFSSTNADRSSFNVSRVYSSIFSYTTLRCATFVSADLSFSTFVGTNIAGANFAYSNLANTSFSKTIGGPVVRLDVNKWSIVVYPDRTQIGCHVYKNDDWLKCRYTDAAICNIHHQASAWWQQYGTLVKSVIRYVVKESKKCRQ